MIKQRDEVFSGQIRYYGGSDLWCTGVDKLRRMYRESQQPRCKQWSINPAALQAAGGLTLAAVVKDRLAWLWFVACGNKKLPKFETARVESHNVSKQKRNEKPICQRQYTIGNGQESRKEVRALIGVGTTKGSPDSEQSGFYKSYQIRNYTIC